MSRSKFQTVVEIPEYPWETGYSKKNMFMGSCFTENVGAKMQELKYLTDINPFGILYNPLSVANGLEILLDKKFLSEEELVKHDGFWHSFSHHGRFSSDSKEKTLDKINTRISISSEFLEEADFLFLTFGTAWVYRLKESTEVVSNCHKIPAKEFDREKLSVRTIVNRYIPLLDRIMNRNPELKVVFTLSPIRHWKDGAIENQRSKAVLLLAIEYLLNHLGTNRGAYFPSYEIVMDELRDYRFYSEDMLHLTEFTIQHIWDVFQNSLIDEQSRKNSKKVRKVLNAVNHKPVNPDSGSFRLFLVKSLKLTEELETILPELNFSEEKRYFTMLMHQTDGRKV